MGTNGTGFQIEYPAITLHAVSRGESGPSIYCQLDESLGTESGAAIADEDTISDMRELTIVPQNSSSCTSFFLYFTRIFILFHVSYFSRDIQWKRYSKPYRNVLRSTPTRRMIMRTIFWTRTRLSTSTGPHSRHSTEMRTRSSVKSGGCAAISSMTTDTRHTRLLFFFAFPNHCGIVVIGCPRTSGVHHL